MEDDEREDEMDKFEKSYNFRFEEEGGTELQTHARKVEDSVRIKESKRKTQREAKKLRKVEEKKSKEIEMDQLRSEKKDEIKSKLL